ncbi:hypothetical protein [Microcoleus sp. D2_18a_D3]
MPGSRSEANDAGVPDTIGCFMAWLATLVGGGVRSAIAPKWNYKQYPSIY